MENERLLDRLLDSGYVLNHWGAMPSALLINLLKAQDVKSASCLIKWLNESCTEHGKERIQKTCAVETYDGKIHEPIIKRYVVYPEHRKDCSKCWKELTGEN
jgi:hypothetical protein